MLPTHNGINRYGVFSIVNKELFRTNHDQNMFFDFVFMMTAVGSTLFSSIFLSYSLVCEHSLPITSGPANRQKTKIAASKSAPVGFEAIWLPSERLLTLLSFLLLSPPFVPFQSVSDVCTSSTENVSSQNVWHNLHACPPFRQTVFSKRFKKERKKGRKDFGVVDVSNNFF